MKKLTEKIVSDVLSAVLAGSLSVAAFAGNIICGDINGDKNVNSADALAALNHSVGADKLEGVAFTRGDVNSDGKVDSSDALDILLYSVGKINNFKAEAVNALKLYSDAVKKARSELPKYKATAITAINSADVTVNDPLGLLALAGISAKELEQEMKNSLVGEPGTESTVCPKGSNASFNNLPPFCKVTDTSKFKSVSLKQLDNGNCQVQISFKDEKNPSDDSVLCSVLGVASYDEMIKELEKSLEIDDGVSVKADIKELSYKNCSLTCVLDPDTGKISDLEWTVTMFMSCSANMVVGISFSMESTVTQKCSDFTY